MTFTLFVGDTGDYLGEHARQHDATAQLIDHHNYLQYINGQAHGTGYTSLGDLPKISSQGSVMQALIERASDVYLVEPKIWSDHRDEFDHWDSRRLIIYYLWEANRRRDNLRSPLGLTSWRRTRYLEDLPQRPSRDPVIWIAGCSISHGVGVADHERYGDVISQNLGLPAVFLTRGGTGIDWSANQILRSDIQPRDIVIWGLTSEYRFAGWSSDHHRLRHINAHSQETSDLRTLGSNLEHRVYSAVSNIHAVVNFCQRISARLMLLPTICTETLRLELHDCPAYHEPPYQHQWVDLGDDNQHPGVKQHRAWADFLLEKIGGSKTQRQP